jgi:hypothetical protein
MQNDVRNTKVYVRHFNQYLNSIANSLVYKFPSEQTSSSIYMFCETRRHAH